MPEPFGTKRFVAKSDQIKFYASEELMNECNAIFRAQGVTLTEGLKRLIRLLIRVPAELRPVILNQAPGEAARVLARYVLKSGKKQATQSGGDVELVVKNQRKHRGKNATTHQ